MSEHTIDELREEWNEAVQEISQARSWQSAAAMRDTAYGKAKRLIVALEADRAAQQQQIAALERGMIELWGIAHDPAVERKIMAVMNMMASALSDAYAALHADTGEKGEDDGEG